MNNEYKVTQVSGVRKAFHEMLAVHLNNPGKCLFDYEMVSVNVHETERTEIIHATIVGGGKDNV